jgi:trehalose 6-phosphate phosphatase
VEDFRREPRRSGIFLDFDGTISEIAPTPEGAVLHPGAAAVLHRLARKYPLCVISGRRVEQLAGLVQIPHTFYVGVHGMEWMEEGPRADPLVEPYLPALREARSLLEERLGGRGGIRLEDKAYSLTLHYRGSPGAEETVLEVAREAAEATGLEWRKGRMSVELRPPVEVDKGTALARLASGWRLKRALYAGDDFTDVDAFRGLRRLMRDGGFEGVAVAVHSPETPTELEAVADLVVEGVEGLVELLSLL